MTEVNKIYCENCLDTMSRMRDGFVDCLITDPPYGYSFMGKDWDKVVPSVEIWKECLRVMKPGAFAFIMSAPRQDVLSHMLVNLDKAGFETGFTSIYWTYASGFPKATNISKAVDKKLGVEQEKTGDFTKRHSAKAENQIHNKFSSVNYDEKTGNIYETVATSDEAKELDGSYAGFQPKPAVEVIIVAMKPLSEKSYTEQALKNKKGITWLDDVRIPYKGDDDIIPQLLQGKTEIKSENGMYGGSSYNESKTKSMIGGDTDGRFPANLLCSDDVLNDGKIYSSGFAEVGDGGNGESNFMPNSKVYSCFNDSGSFSRFYDLDKWWEERIKTLPENVRKVFPFLIEPKAAKSEKNFGLNSTKIVTYFCSLWDENNIIQEVQLAQHLGDTEILLERATEEFGMQMKKDSEWNTSSFGNNITEKSPPDTKFTMMMKTNSTTKSQILNWWIGLLTSEYTVDARSLTVHGGNLVVNVENFKLLPNTIQDRMASVLDVKSAAYKLQFRINEKDGSNIHPTCKPLKLMSYLIVLGSREGDVILEPFAGSGTTCIAAHLQNRNYIASEINKEYYEIAVSRIKQFSAQQKLQFV